MKNYSFITLAAIVCLSALPSYAQDSSSTEGTVPPSVESPKVTTQSEPTIVGVASPVKNRQQPAPEPDKCESVDR